MHQRCMTLYKKAMRIHIAFLFMDHKIDALLIYPITQAVPVQPSVPLHQQYLPTSILGTDH